MEKKNGQTGRTRAQRVTAGILAVLFLITIVGFGAYGVLKDPKGMLESVKFYKAKSYLKDPEDTGFFPMMSARIASLQNHLGKNLLMEDRLSALNASFQFGLGKNMIVKGAQQMLRLPNGQLYAMADQRTLASEAEEIVDLYEYLNGEIPFLFSYVHPAFFDGGLQLPAGYDVIDTGDELGDEILGVMRNAGIETLDSRTFFKDTGLTNEELMLKTDKHWTALAALLTAKIYAEEINRLTGAELDVSKLDANRFTSETYPDLFLGDYGEPLGRRNADVEDITIHLPDYPTDITRHSEHRRKDGGHTEDVRGDFGEAVLRRENLEREELGYSRRAHKAYGLIEKNEVLVNNGDCEDMTILVLRDSFSEPVCGFLSLVAKKVVSADLCYSDKTAVELIEEYQPDMVIVSFSRLKFVEHKFNLGLPET